jgi:hypothetical protein
MFPKYFIPSFSITRSEAVTLSALFTQVPGRGVLGSGNDLTVGDGRRGDDHPVDVLAREELVEILVERDATLGGLPPASPSVFVPDCGDLRPRMLLGLGGVVLCVYVPEAQDCDAEHERTSSTISSISSPGRATRIIADVPRILSKRGLTIGAQEERRTGPWHALATS